jgi:RNase P subunit RPR2
MKSTTQRTREWRCGSCHALLGVGSGGEIEIRYKAAAYRVRGELTTQCRRCGAASRFVTDEKRSSHPN